MKLREAMAYVDRERPDLDKASRLSAIHAVRKGGTIEDGLASRAKVSAPIERKGFIRSIRDAWREADSGWAGLAESGGPGSRPQAPPRTPDPGTER